MVKLKIDGRQVEVEPGSTLLDAGRALGLDIPALCHLKGYEPATSCMVCVVWVGSSNGRLVPSCAVAARDGMEVESETDEVHRARRTALELLLSDHLGDCIAPCNRICPVDINVPLFTRYVAAGDVGEAIRKIREESPMPAVLSRICPANCENGCRRATGDDAVSVSFLERHAADSSLRGPEPYVPEVKPDTGKSVAVIGAGPAGLSAAYFLRRRGHACVLYEQSAEAGGSLRTQTTEDELPRDILDAEIDVIRRMGVDFRLATRVGSREALEAIRSRHDAVLLACGEMEEGERTSWGLPAAAAGVQVDGGTFQTELPGLFAAGDVVKAQRRPVRAMSDGKTAALAIEQYVWGLPVAAAAKRFSCRAGKMSEDEVGRFVALVSPEPRRAPPAGAPDVLSSREAASEAERCLHCDCRRVHDCKLRMYAERYGADPGRFKTERRQFEQRTDHPHVIFEPGKCILCGLCIQIAADEKERLGLTFVGRGFDVRVGVPFDATLEEALRETALKVIEHCPTGALAPKAACPYEDV